jgi:Archaea bacterial proteins of unknown function
VVVVAEVVILATAAVVAEVVRGPLSRVGLAYWSTPKVGGWWGNALNEHRRDGTRQSEEIDVVGLRRSSVVVLGECRWQSKMRLAKDLSIVLFSKSGFGAKLVETAEERSDLLLVGVDQLVEISSECVSTGAPGVHCSDSCRASVRPRCELRRCNAFEGASLIAMCSASREPQLLSD